MAVGIRRSNVGFCLSLHDVLPLFVAGGGGYLLLGRIGEAVLFLAFIVGNSFLFCRWYEKIKMGEPTTYLNQNFEQCLSGVCKQFRWPKDAALRMRRWQRTLAVSGGSGHHG